MVKEFYSNVAHILKGTKVTNVRKKNVVFTRKAINEYPGFNDEDESLYNEKLEGRGGSSVVSFIPGNPGYGSRVVPSRGQNTSENFQL